VAEQRLDVSELEPPEPLVRTLAAADTLARGDYLHMIHRRHPCLLFDNLDQRGFGHIECEVAPSRFELFIWYLGDAEAEAEARRAAGLLSR